MRKVYIFYYQKGIYAWTTDKYLRDVFISERNMNKMKMKKWNMNDEEYLSFSVFYHNQQLDTFVYGSDSGYCDIVATLHEDEQVGFEVDVIGSTLTETVERLLSDDSIRCHDDIEYLSNTRIRKTKSWNDETYYESRINTLTIFVKLFKDTF